MSATTIATPVAVSYPNKLRYALVALAVVGLLAMTFVIGRWTSPSATTVVREIAPNTAPVIRSPDATDRADSGPSVVVPCNAGEPC
jgi:hypothetical protein